MSRIKLSPIISAARIAGFFAALCLSTPGRARTLPVGEFRFEAISERIYVMHGPLSQPSPENHCFMNNPGLIVGASGLILIDPGASLQIGKKILQQAAKVSPLPVVAVFNTHIHGDHWLANQAVRRAYPEADIYAHPRSVSQALGSEGAGWLQVMSRLTDGLSDGTEIVTANKTVKHGDRLLIEGEEFRIHAMHPSHTDIMIEHVASRTIFTGDNTVNLRLGRFDESSSIVGNIAALEYLVEQNFETVVPGHGRSGDSQSTLLPYLEYLRTLEDTVSEGQRAELEDYEIKQQALPRFANFSHWSEFDQQFGRNLNKMFLELEAF